MESLPDLLPAAPLRAAAFALAAALLAAFSPPGGDRTSPLPPPRITIDLERDGPARLALLPGVGPVRARALVRFRKERGALSPAVLEQVPGLGPATAARIRKVLGLPPP